jgi:threonine/homoserine/homoserine lactone efflux protein
MKVRVKYKIARGLIVSIVIGTYVTIGIMTHPLAVLLGVTLALGISAAVFEFIKWLETGEDQCQP